MQKVARDHFVPRAYLRGFTPEYLAGGKGGVLVQFHPGLGLAKKLSINDRVGCEPCFYDNHPIDKRWSQTIEQKWPQVRTRLKDREQDAALLDDLLWFVSAQYIRTHTFMDQVAKRVALEQAKRHVTRVDGREGMGMFVGMADTGEVMNRVERYWGPARAYCESDYVWSLCHNSRTELFLTSDDPCQWVPNTGEVIMPIALDMALVGRLIRPDEEPSFAHTNASQELIRKVNRRIVAGCNSWVYAHEDTPGLRRFVEKNKKRSVEPTGGRSFSNDGRPMTEEEIARLMERVQRLRAEKGEKKD